MDYFASVERELRGAMRQGRVRRRRGGRRLAVGLVLCVLMGGSALAATGVIPIGSPVKVPAGLNPGAGSGVPAPGGSVLLGLSVDDPQGGPPWGLRVVRTTRGLVCLQVARLEGGELGELGVDGAFHDDGRFHPLPTAALPDAGGELGHAFSEIGSDSYCHLPSETFLGDSIGTERSAAGPADTSRRPRAQLRDLYFGLLGPQAVSVSWAEGSTRHTEPVVPGVGAFLFVTGTSAHDQVATGGGSIGSAGGLAPVAPLTGITYRLRGSLCERLLPGVRAEHPCPPPQSLFPRTAPAGRPLHVPLRLALRVSHRVIRGLSVSFRAPLAVTSAAEGYQVRVPIGLCHGPLGGYVGQSTDRDIAAGANVVVEVGDPFQDATCGRRTATVEVFYTAAGGPGRRIGLERLTEPPGVRSARLPARPRR